MGAGEDALQEALSMNLTLNMTVSPSRSSSIVRTAVNDDLKRPVLHHFQAPSTITAHSPSSSNITSTNSVTDMHCEEVSKQTRLSDFLLSMNGNSMCTSGSVVGTPSLTISSVVPTPANLTPLPLAFSPIISPLKNINPINTCNGTIQQLDSNVLEQKEKVGYTKQMTHITSSSQRHAYRKHPYFSTSSPVFTITPTKPKIDTQNPTTNHPDQFALIDMAHHIIKVMVEPLWSTDDLMNNSNNEPNLLQEEPYNNSNFNNSTGTMTFQNSSTNTTRQYCENNSIASQHLRHLRSTLEALFASTTPARIQTVSVLIHYSLRLIFRILYKSNAPLPSSLRSPTRRK
jgi:hypothetical protein